MFRISFWTRISSNQNIVRSKVSSVLTLRYCAGIHNESHPATCGESYSSFIEKQLSEAQKSLLFYIQSEKNVNKVISVCEKYGPIKKIYLSKNNLRVGSPVTEDWLVVEMENLSSARDLLSAISEKHGSFLGIPRPFIDVDFSSILKKPVSFSGTILCKNSVTQSVKSLLKKSDVHWLWKVYEAGKLNDFDWKLRYLVISYISSIVQVFWKNGSVVPFGSTGSGFATLSSDVDITLISVRKKFNYLTFRHSGELKPKGMFWEFEKIFRYCATGCTVNGSIPSAKFPIIKLTVDYVDVKCDLCFNNEKGLRSTELVYLAGRAHGMLQPMSIVLLKWAREVHLSKISSPSCRIPNFALITLIVFFLQNFEIKGFHLLPSLEVLVRESKKTEAAPSSPPGYARHSDSEKVKAWLESCLYEFFLFYTNFNFSDNSICIGSGKTLPYKSFNHPMVLINPVDKNENITRMVSEFELRRIIEHFKRCGEMYREKDQFTPDFMKCKYYESLNMDSPVKDFSFQKSELSQA